MNIWARYRMQGVIFQIFSYFSNVLSLYRHLFITLSHRPEIKLKIIFDMSHVACSKYAG